MAVDSKWHQAQIQKYKIEFPHYETYAQTLQKILEAACGVYAPLAIVQTRPKSVSSFAEKAARKAFKYDNPVTQLTDLCGARVITDTQEAADRLCAFIRKNFAIDDANSPDVRTRLQTSEFGYLSVHYVLQVRAKEILGIKIPNEIGERKAEIQVRTLTQHAWANIAHDRIYKSQFNVPQPCKRELARLAALLEVADETFAEVIRTIDAYAVDYGAHMEPEARKAEIDMLEVVLKNEPKDANKPGIALRIARLAKAAGEWQSIVDHLDPYLTVKGRLHPEVLREHGYALCRVHKAHPGTRLYKQGQTELEAAVNEGEEKTRIQALSDLGWTHRNSPNEEVKARERYRQAFEADPSNPYNLASFIEYEIFCGKEAAFVQHMRPTLFAAIKTCMSHVEAGIELPWAFFTMGKLYLLLGQPYDSLAAYAKGVWLCSKDKSCAAEETLDAEQEFLHRINFGKELPPEHSWVRDVLLLAKTVNFADQDSLKAVKARDLRKKPFIRPVRFVVGAADPSVEHDMQQYRAGLLDAFDGFTGTLCSGGTTSGIPGIVGAIAKLARTKTKTALDTIAYLPKSLPTLTSADKRYSELLTTDGREFSPAQPIQNWIDLLAAGVQPSEVIVLGVNGGSVAAFEYRLSLALGATVGIVESSGRAANELQADGAFWESEKLLWLPDDPMTLRAFVNKALSRLARKQDTRIKKLGRTIHKTFLEENRYKNLDPAMMPWDQLREDLKESNRDQAVYAVQALQRAGYGVRKATGKNTITDFTKKEVDVMAEMEHGRWNVERLKAGWRLGPKRDSKNKITPYLVSWKDLPEEIKKCDRDPVRNWPKVFAEAGLEVYRL